MSLARYLPRFRHARRELASLAARESWSCEQIEAHQLERLNAIWRNATAHVPYYRQLAHRHDLPLEFSSIAEFQSLVPTLEKSTVATHGRELLAANARPGRWHSTSGSTGMPTRVFRTHADQQEMLRAKYRFYASWGAEIFDRTAWLWSGVDSRRASKCSIWFQRAQDRLRSRLRMPAASLDPESLRQDLRDIAAFRPAYLYGYSRALYMLALQALERNFHCKSLKFVCMTGENATPRMKQTVERAFNVPAVIEYGSVECGFLAGEAFDRTLRIRADIAIVESLPRDDGLFDIVVTPLTNGAFPLLRYKIGDLTDRPIATPDRGFPIFNSIAGRNDDVLVSSSGSAIHATAFDELFEYADEPIRVYRVHQHIDGSISASVAPLRDGDRIDLARITTELSALVEGYPVDVRTVETIPQTPAGKHRLVTSDLAVQLNRQLPALAPAMT